MVGISEYQRHLEALAVKIGPRGSATKDEEAAGEYVAAQLRSHGLECHYQRFKAPTSFSWAYMLLFATAPAAAVLFPFQPAVAFVLALAGALGYLLEVSTYSLFSRLVPKGRSVNVVAKAHARSKELQRILVLAHLDSSRSALNFSPRLVAGFRRSFFTTFGSLWVLAALYGAGLFWSGAPQTALWLFSLLPAAAVTVALLLLVHREIAGRITPGANDDASGLAVLLETARIIARAPLATVSVWFVATGAEESGLWGALHLIRECALDRAKTAVINLDNLGAGRLALTTGEGMVIPLRSGRALVEAAQETAAQKGLDLQLRPYHLLTTDATAFMARHIPAATIMAFDERGLLPNWHWPTDTADRVDEANLAAARDLVVGMIRILSE